MKSGDPRKLRDFIGTLDNLGYCFVAVCIAMVAWGVILLFDCLFNG